MEIYNTYRFAEKISAKPLNNRTAFADAAHPSVRVTGGFAVLLSAAAKI